MNKKKVVLFFTIFSIVFSSISYSSVQAEESKKILNESSYKSNSNDYVGTFFIQNYKSQTFMQIDDNASSSQQSAKMEVWGFDSNSIQKWTISLLDSGYYKIVSAKSSLALSVPSGKENSNEVALVQETYTGANRQQWSIHSNSDGTVTIKPRSGEGSSKDFRMSIGDGIFTYDGRNVEQSRSQSDNSDKWYLHLASEYAYLSFNARIYYDDTSLLSVSEDQINEAYENATTGILVNHNIKFNNTLTELSDLISPDFSGCDASTLDDFCTVLCSAFETCNTYHHRSARRLATASLTSNSYYTCRVVGYALCVYDDGTHKQVGGSAVVGGKDFVASTQFSEDLDIIFQHELTHNLGATHNCTVGQSCILKNTANRWCDACEAAIKNNY